MDLQLKNRTALVTGSTAGIGIAIAEALTKEGASVIVNGRTQERVDKALKQCGTSHGIAADLATEAGDRELIAKFPEVDILTNTAQLALLRGLAEGTSGTAVTVNALLPGPTASEGVLAFVDKLAQRQGAGRESVERDFFQNARPSSILQRFANPEEVAVLVTFVCSPLAAAFNGAAFRVDGGVARALA